MYQALYRKWRPRTFDDVVGQEHITETLKNQVASGRLSHAYLFIGTRGTGKTTCAKILSKAVNCLNPVNGNPCNRCSACLGIDDGSIMDVVEMDAASNNGVDHVRALRDEAIFSPASVAKRVYIIDEVHMMSNQAFNALLKILLDQRVEDHNGDHAYHDAGVLDQLGQFQCGVRGVGVGTLLSLVHQQNVAQNDLQCLEAIITDVDEAGEIVVPWQQIGNRRPEREETQYN